jgi:hypothetical protein
MLIDVLQSLLFALLFPFIYLYSPFARENALFPYPQPPTIGGVRGDGGAFEFFFHSGGGVNRSAFPPPRNT